jgi:acetyl-CoA decarbonylase/synthase complex subunit gamma
MNYTVDPGLYALGQPGADSRVFVTANYKMSFDRLRASLTGSDVWLLVLDTNGINVWCAAGKDTFGTDELVSRIEGSGLADLVSRRELILPQLGAPGIAAHEVKARSGFRVIYGPVRAEDLPSFIESGLKATPEMRTKTFSALERLVLVPIELVSAAKVGIAASACLFVLSLFLGGFSLSRATEYTLAGVVALGAAILAGAVLAPVFLPWLPGRAFSLKGFVAGLFVVAGLLSGGATPLHLSQAALWSLALSIPAMSAYLAMNFTGSSTFTSLSGVRKEMRFALPLEIAGTAAGFALWVTGLAIGR